MANDTKPSPPPSINLPKDIAALDRPAVEAILRATHDESEASEWLSKAIMSYIEAYEAACQARSTVLPCLPFARPTTSEIEKAAYDLANQEIKQAIEGAG
ncbi:MAG: hypothetical protein AAF442_00110 [Pseudomonadota bacterium]